MNIELKQYDTHSCGYFRAMASPCEVLIDTQNRELAYRITELVAAEAFRIENKFSRYRDDNIIYDINTSQGRTITVDDETTRLLHFADKLYKLSEGLFDITSGVLREVWKFDGSDNIPGNAAISALLPRVGWHRVHWHSPQLTLEDHMEIDLGGIGKEYAVDRCIQIAREQTDTSVLVNFGGDLAMSHPRNNNEYWSVGRLVTGKDTAASLFELRRGAIATSGDAHRYLVKDGVRYGHVLNPKNGWPIKDTPHTVSVAAPSCVEAGMLSTLAMLQGDQAESFLKLQDVSYWID